MSRPQDGDRKPFAEVLREVREQPAQPEPDRGGVSGPDGTRWVKNRTSIEPGEAVALVEHGAGVAWDPCGCGGFCGFTWFTTEEVARLAAAGSPTVRNTKRRRGNISEWVADNGRVLVVAEDAVRWSDLLD